jgi:hypothetical protein
VKQADGKYQGVTLAARFLNDLNHMVDTWAWFIGAWIYDTQMMGGKTDCEKGCGAKCGETDCGIMRQEDMKLISTCPTLAEGGKPCYDGNTSAYFQLMPQYHYAKQLRAAFDLGCSMRYSTVNATFLGVRGGNDMAWTYGKKPPIHVAVGKNPDGSYAVGIANPTGIPTRPVLNGKATQIFPNASMVVLELVLEELLPASGAEEEGAELRFVARRSTGDESYSVPEADVALAGGVLHTGRKCPPWGGPQAFGTDVPTGRIAFG